MSKNLFLTIFLFLGAPQPMFSQASEKAIIEGIDGNALLAECTQVIRLLDGESLTEVQTCLVSSCLGYMEGFSDAQLWYVALMDADPIYCSPKGAKFGQLVRVIVK